MRNIIILTILTTVLIFTSFIKNKTRLLEKELVNLNNKINSSSSNLAEAVLDFEYLTTPQHISFLAKNFLDENFSYYEASQINPPTKHEKNLNNDQLIIKEPVYDDLNIVKKINNTQLFVSQKLDNKQPQILEKKVNSRKVQRWAGMQVIKALLGIPTLPGIE